ncbi:MAG: rhomboid family intramembrane serine protease [Rhodospirillaceae bacterium]|nr:rhomboid family intramembrane serine protease [Rhodospirillaceae bacterium]
MFLPIRDDNPHTATPFVNYGLIAACVAVFLWQFSLGDAGDAAVMVFGLIPGHLFGTVAPDPALPIMPALLTVFSSMFLHGGWMHLGGNMLYLWVFGDNIEASLGHGRYLVFYLLCGVAAALAQSIAAPTSDVPMVGASGAIAGVLGAYLVLHPRSNIKVFVFLIVIITFINIPAFIVLGIWFVAQLMSSAAADPNAPGVAFLAHIGGFVAGAVLVFFFKKRSVVVFEPAHSRAFAVEKRPLRRRGSVPEVRRGNPWN